jgi:hypothetical protein
VNGAARTAGAGGGAGGGTSGDGAAAAALGEVGEVGRVDYAENPSFIPADTSSSGAAGEPADSGANDNTNNNTIRVPGPANRIPAMREALFGLLHANPAIVLERPYRDYRGTAATDLSVDVTAATERRFLNGLSGRTRTVAAEYFQIDDPWWDDPDYVG